MSPKIHSFLLYSQDPHQVARFYKSLGFDDIIEDINQIRIKSQGLTLCYIDQQTVKFPLKNDFPKGGGIYIYFEVSDVNAYYDAIKDQGLTPSTEPQDQPWGKREFVIKDPDNYKLVFYQNIA